MAFNRIALGTATMSASSVIRLMAQFFIVPILSRILSPADYGIMAMAMPFVIFTMMFTDAGVGQSLVRAAEQERGVWSTSFFLTIACGSAFALFIICLAPLVSMFFREPHLTYIIMALAVVIIPQAGATIPEAALRRDHRFMLLALTEIISVFIGMSLAIFVALKGGGAWALVAQQLGLYWSRFLLAFSLSSFRPTLQFDLRSIKEHLLFGKDVLGAKFVWYLTSAMDGPIIGKVLGSMTLGYYSMAAMFSRLPVNVIVGPVQYVVFAHCAPLRDDKAALRQMMLTLTRMLAIVIFPGVGMLAAAHYAVFKLLLSEKWIPSGELFVYLAASTALGAVTGLRSVFMMIIGRVDLQLRSAIEYFFVLLVTLLVFVWFGIKWLVIGYSLSVFLYFPRSLALLLPHLECSLAQYTKVLIAPAVVTGICILVYEAINDIFHLGDWLQLFLGGFLGVLGIVGSALVQFRPLKQEFALLRDKW
jgi:O-antigen/teichoic acid export membrane protein